MKKYYSIKGEEVKLGDEVTFEEVFKVPHGKMTSVTTMLVTKKTLPYLIDKGVVKEEEIKKEPKKEVVEVFDSYVGTYINKIARRLNWNAKKAENILNTVIDIYPAAAFSILLKEIAIQLDKQYEDHITKSPEIYVVSMFDGSIQACNKKGIRSFKNFAAFRTRKDAETAMMILAPFAEDLFNLNYAKQED